MMLYALILILLFLLVLRFLYLGKEKERFKVATINFGHKNNDPLVIKKGKECLIIVTDPVGTSRSGESACLIAKQTIVKFYETSIANVSPTEFLKKACFLAHRAIGEQMNANSGGCSIALVYIHNKQLNYASVGDIKIGVFGRELHQMNQLDLYKYQLSNQVLERKINEDHLLNNSLRNELTGYLGHENLKKVNLSDQHILLKRYDKLLITTKGIYNVITPLELEFILRQGTPIKNIEVLKQIYHEQRLKDEKKQASGVIISHFK